MSLEQHMAAALTERLAKVGITVLSVNVKKVTVTGPSMDYQFAVLIDRAQLIVGPEKRYGEEGC